MKYAYLVFMTPYNHNPGNSQGKTLLGVHTSSKSAFDHFSSVIDDRRKRQLVETISFIGCHNSMPDWCNRRLRHVHVKYRLPDGQHADWYITDEHIEVEQWKVSSRSSRKKQKKRGGR